MARCRSATIGLCGITLCSAIALGLPSRPADAAPADFKHAELASTARLKFIIPGYENLGQKLTRLNAAVGSLCKSPTSEHLQYTHKAYRDTAAAWGKVEFVQFGPIAQRNRYERIFYWPDRKGRGRRQVLRLLSATGESALEASRFAKKSVAVQGLTALEHVLFDEASRELEVGSPNSFRCRYAAAIVANLQNITTAILEGWRSNGAFEKIWRSPGPDNPAYLRSSETSLELVKALDHGLENLRDRRIAPVLGFGKNRRRKSRPVLWRSKTSMILIDANIEGLHDLLFNSGLADAYVASRPDDGERAKDLMASIKSEFELTLGMSRQLASEPDPFSDPKIMARLVPIGFPLKNIRHNAVNEIKAAAGLAIGFNASDGD